MLKLIKTKNKKTNQSTNQNHKTPPQKINRERQTNIIKQTNTKKNFQIQEQ
jgi:hypothetical protein